MSLDLHKTIETLDEDFIVIVKHDLTGLTVPAVRNKKRVVYRLGIEDDNRFSLKLTSDSLRSHAKRPGTSQQFVAGSADDINDEITIPA